MPYAVSLREICALLNGTDLQVIILSRQAGANYRLQRRGAAQLVDVWADYQSMEEMRACPFFRHALERARDSLADDDPRQQMLSFLLTH